MAATFQASFDALLSRLAEVHSPPGASAEERFERGLILFGNLCGIAVIGLLIPTYGYLELGQAQLAAGLCTLGWIANIAAFRWHGRTGWLLRTTFALVLVYTAAEIALIHHALPVDTLIDWGLVVPIVAALFLGRREALLWLAADLALIGASLVLVDRSVAPLHPSTGWVGQAFEAINEVGLALITFLIVFHLSQQRRVARDALEREHRKSEELLLNMLPPSIADRLKQTQGTIADHFEEATILFADIVGFTVLSSRVPPDALVRLLDEIFTDFDALAEKHGLEKIKTIGDAYMVVGGLPQRRPDHAPAVARMALEMLEAVKRRAGELGEPLNVRIGINSGPVVAGVIGRKKFIYDLWGDAVNVASRMESHGVPGGIHLTESTFSLLKDDFLLESRGTIAVKGKGEMPTWLLQGARA